MTIFNFHFQLLAQIIKFKLRSYIGYIIQKTFDLDTNNDLQMKINTGYPIKLISIYQHFQIIYNQTMLVTVLLHD